MVLNFKINEKMVLFPAPEGPTNAVIFPLSISKLIFFITSLSSLYEKNTSLNDNFPSILSGVMPLSELDISIGLFVISLYCVVVYLLFSRSRFFHLKTYGSVRK